MGVGYSPNPNLTKKYFFSQTEILYDFTNNCLIHLFAVLSQMRQNSA